MDSQYEIKYNNLMQGLEEMHEKNVQRTKAAFKCLLIIPAVILIMLFMTKGSKTIFLALWIASMFIIAFVLIIIEYQDYLLRKMVAKSRAVSEGEAEPESGNANAAPAADTGSAGEARQAIAQHASAQCDEPASDFKYDNYDESADS